MCFIADAAVAASAGEGGGAGSGAGGDALGTADHLGRQGAAPAAAGQVPVAYAALARGAQGRRPWQPTGKTAALRRPQGRQGLLFFRQLG